MVLAADASSLASGRCRKAPVDPIQSFDRSLPRDYSSTTGPRPGSAPFWITHSNALLVSFSLALSSLLVSCTLATFRSSLFPSLFLSHLFFPLFSYLSLLVLVFLFRHRTKSLLYLSLSLSFSLLRDVCSCLLRYTYEHSYTTHHQSLLYTTRIHRRLALLRHSSVPRQRNSFFSFPPVRFARDNKTSRTMPSPPPPPPPSLPPSLQLPQGPLVPVSSTIPSNSSTSNVSSPPFTTDIAHQEKSTRFASRPSSKRVLAFTVRGHAITYRA